MVIDQEVRTGLGWASVLVSEIDPDLVIDPALAIDQGPVIVPSLAIALEMIDPEMIDQTLASGPVIVWAAEIAPSPGIGLATIVPTLVSVPATIDLGSMTGLALMIGPVSMIDLGSVPGRRTWVIS